MEDLISQLVALSKGIWKYRFWAVATAWVVLILGTIGVYTVPNQYDSKARVFVDTQSILKPLLSGMTTVPNVEYQVNQISRTLLTRPNVEKVIRMVDLDLNSKSTKDHEKLVDDLMKDIKFSGTAQNDIYTISYTHKDPKIVRDVVQAFLTIFVESSFGDKKQDSQKAIAFINEQIKNYEQKLVAAEAALKEFKLKNIGLLPREGGAYASKVQETTDALNQARLDLREAERARDAMRDQIASIPPGAMRDVTPVAPTSQISEIDVRIMTIQKNLDNLRLQYTDEHPDIIAGKRLLRQLETAKKAEVKELGPSAAVPQTYSPILQQMKMQLANADARVASLRARVDEYAARVTRMQSMSVAAPAVEQQLAQLNRDYMINKENYEKLVASRESAKLSGELSATTEMMTFRVIDPPTTPQVPTGPNRPLLLGVVLLLALVLGIVVATVMSKIRPTFVTQNALRETTNLPVLGAVGLYWTPAEQDRHRRKIRMFTFSLVMLLIAFAAAMTPVVKF